MTNKQNKKEISKTEDGDKIRYERAFGYFLNIHSPSYANAYKSAIRAGFSESFAKSKFTSSKKWKSLINTISDMAEIARNNLKFFVELDIETPILDAKTGNIVGSKIDPRLGKIKLDTSIFVLETLNKNIFCKKVEFEEIKAPQVQYNPDLKKSFKINNI
jgi:hypothetical protein